MPYTALTVQTIDRTKAGTKEVTFTAVDQANGNEFANDGSNVTLFVKNTDAAAKKILYNVPETVDLDLEIGEVDSVNFAGKRGRVYDIANQAGGGDYTILPPVPGAYFNQDTTNVVQLDFDSGTSLSVAAVIIDTV